MSETSPNVDFVHNTRPMPILPDVVLFSNPGYFPPGKETLHLAMFCHFLQSATRYGRVPDRAEDKPSSSHEPQH